MPASDLRLFPDPILRKPCQPVRCFDSSLARILQKMLKVMHAQPSGIGIAAPQIGVALRIALVDVSARVRGARLRVLINPEIAASAKEKLSHEGCMSVPDYTGYLQRYDRIRVRFKNEQGRPCELSAEGIEAVCIQHEMDHLKGKLFIDHVISLKHDLLPRDWKRRKKRPGQ